MTAKGGECIEEGKKKEEVSLANFLQYSEETFRLTSQIQDMPDSRKSPEISIGAIAKAVIIGAGIGAESLRQIDQSLRLGMMGGRIRGKKGCRISDTTISRVCARMEVGALDKTLQAVGQKIRQEGMLGVSVGGQRCRVGIVDGSSLGGQLASVLLEAGDVPTCLGLERIPKRGKELPVSLALIESKTEFNKLDYLLADGLYACEEFWRVCESKGVIGVVKTPEESLTIIQDANGLFDAKERLEGIEFAEGTDAHRDCTFRVWGVENLPWSQRERLLKVVRVEETFFKGKFALETHRFWVLSQDQSLSAISLRELAHSRWFIENKGFKALNEQVHSKHLYSHDSDTAWVVSLLQIIGAMLISAYHWFLSAMKESLEWLWDHGSFPMRCLRKCLWSFWNLARQDTS